MLIFSKLFAILLAAIAITKTFYDYKKHKESFTTFLFWLFAWMGIIYISLYPSIFYEFIQSLSDENVGMGTIIGIAFVFMFFLVYRVYTKANRLEQKIKDIVMKIGIKDIEEND